MLTYRLSSQGETSEEISVPKLEILAYSTNKNYTCGQKMRDIGAILCYCGCIVLRKMMINFTLDLFFAVQNCECTILVLRLVFV